MADEGSESDVKQRLASLTSSRDSAEALAALGGQDGVARLLGTSLRQGIAEAEVPSRKARFGENRLPTVPPTSLWQHFVDSLDDRDLKILIVAAVASVCFGMFVTADMDDAIQGCAIMAAVVIVSTVSTIQNYRQEVGFQALTQVAANRPVTVRRDGKLETVSVFELVPGDVLTVGEGLLVPADGVLLEPSFAVRVDQSSLTGESDAVEKGPANPIMLFGTTVLEGEGSMLVTAVGEATPTGKQFAEMMQKRDAKRTENTPMQDKLEDVAEQIGYLGMVVGALTFLVLTTLWLFVDGPLDPDGNMTDDADVSRSWADLVTFFIVGVSIVVVAVPEGLPLSVTISLAYSVSKMMDDNNYVRTLSACETMGGATVICTDKTGTLTENRMSVVRGWCFGHSVDDMSRLADTLGPDLSDRLAQGIVLNSSAGLDLDEVDHTGKPRFRGNPTEASMLWCATERLRVNYETMREEAVLVARRPFRKVDKFMSSVLRRPGAGTLQLYTKGAPEVVLRHCASFMDTDGSIKALSAAHRQRILRETKAMAHDGLRTIALTTRALTDAESEAAGQDSTAVFHNKPEHDMVFMSVLGIADPLRKEVPAAVNTCQQAGIRVVMVTGDHLITATSIARQCNILPRSYTTPAAPISTVSSRRDLLSPSALSARVKDTRVMEGFDFRSLVAAVTAAQAAADANPDDATLASEAADMKQQLNMLVDRICVLARSSPKDKAVLVQLLKERKEVVGVTGDGTNDAPALLEADVGLAMGIAGTDVAKEAANIVILDDNFFSIVASVKWGRSIRENIRKFLLFQLTINVVALALTFVVACFNKGSTTKFPLTSVQLLWVNLIMDSFAALALATEPPTEALLHRKPEDRDAPMITRTMWKHMLGHAFMQTVVLLFITLSPEGNAVFGIAENGSRLHYTAVFNTFVWLNVFNKLNCRKIHDELNVFGELGESTMAQVIMVIIVVGQWMMVQLGGDWCQTIPLSSHQWLVCVGIGSLSLLWGFLLRLVFREKAVQVGVKPPASSHRGLQIHSHHE